jgi:hypothetical protein
MHIVATGVVLCATLFGIAGAAGGDEPPIPNQWLDRQVNVEEAEVAHPGITDDRVARFPEAAKPFAFKHREWEELKAAMQPGDEIWTFSSPTNSWQDLAGRAGVALVRNGTPVKVIVTMMN